MLGNEPFLSHLALQEMPHGVVEAQGAPIEVEVEEQRQTIEVSKQVLGFELVQAAGLSPEARDNPDGDVGILREHAELLEASAPVVIQELQTDTNGASNSLGAIGLVARVT